MNSFHYTFSARLTLHDRVWFDEPTWADIEPWFMPVFEKGGGLSLSLRHESTLHIENVTVRADVRRYLLTATIRSPSGDHVICWQDPENTPPRGMTDLLGDDWDARWIQSDPLIPARVFQEIFETGQLSPESKRRMR